MNTNQKPLTKALHTVRVVERIALHLVATEGYDTTDALYGAVLDVLGNERPTDTALFEACHEACRKVLS